MKLTLKEKLLLIALIALTVSMPISLPKLHAAINDRNPNPVVRQPLGSATPPSPTVESNQQHPIMLVRTFVDTVQWTSKDSLSYGSFTRTNYVLGYYDRQKLVEIGIVDSLSLKR